MNNILISIIVPMYNAEKTIGRLIESILLQTEDRFELIVVDDGSLDKSVDIVQSYMKKDVRIKLISQENGGPLAAIRVGVKNSIGQYISFVDADDKCEDSFLSEMYNLICKYNADISVSGFYNCIGNETLENRMCDRITCYDENYIKNELISEFISGRKLQGVRWNKMYGKDIIIKTLYNMPNDFNYGEDAVMVLGCFLEARRIVVTDKCLYYYYDTENSLQKKMRRIGMSAAYDMYDNMVIMIKHYQREDLLSKAAYNFWTELLLFFKSVNKTENKYKEKKEIFKQTLNNSKIKYILEDVECDSWKRGLVINLMLKEKIFLLIILFELWKIIGIN